ncbi:tRNA (guanine-N(7)-)-methyltransferase non-catalytic subunit trm82 [Steccherinum ochraceum]|uniref:tRNA (Guanine-N(7)-)-methyltransferase non-catalytic subunit trm82 n=1 Tax=Steccherinum ochraceum TaxID=92696 RepID=A0A4R0RL77_9APHY|nr:tRNA (guanine-N(7)-)-methyltransferase non-catalytic subunit trm82 [Steccherinum ochraceum]
MPSYPHTRLHVGPSSSVVVSGPYIQLVNNASGAITAIADESTTTKSGPIRCSAVDTKWKWVVAAGDDKKLRVWDINDNLKMVSERELPKKPTEIRITQDSETILVSDKFGDVFRYPMIPSTEQESAARPQVTGRGALTSHENLAGGSLVLGHASLLTSFLLSDDEKFIITADRDEHIRVSWYPQGYVIEQYCLGHTKFVSAIHIPSFSPHSLISGGGDPYLQCWNWTTGKKISSIPILDAVLPFITVKPPKGRAWSNGDEEEGGGAEKPGRRKGKGKKGKGKEKAGGSGDAAEPAQDEGAESSEVADAASAGIKDGEAKQSLEDVIMAEEGRSEQEVSRTQEEQDPTLVVNRIETVQLSDESRWIVFSAIGATALFYTRHPVDEFAESSTIYSLDFEKPVIDFISWEAGNFLVHVDSEWTDSTAETQGRTEFARSASWSQTESGWKLSEESNKSPLINSLNSACLKSATPAELKVADIYAHLASMPKNVDPEHDPIVRDDLATLDPSELTEDAVEGKGKLTQRELARLKNKRALVESIKGKEVGKSATPEVVEEGRESKKAKSDEEVEVAMNKS